MAELIREVVMDASPATIFPFLTDPAQHVRWMGTEAELDPRVGGVYRVLAHGQHPGVGEFLEVVPDRKVVFTFGWDEPEPPDPRRQHRGGDHPDSRRRQDQGPPHPPGPAGRRRQRPFPRVGSLPRPTGHRLRRRRVSGPTSSPGAASRPRSSRRRGKRTWGGVTFRRAAMRAPRPHTDDVVLPRAPPGSAGFGVHGSSPVWRPPPSR